jgi:hypothetical protein
MRNLLITAILILLSLPLLAGEWNQYYFSFRINDRSELQQLTSIISIDNVRGNTVWAYANDTEWEAFQRLGYTAELLPAPASLYQHELKTASEVSRLWDAYPSYDEYVNMMYAFQTNYPNLCQIIDAGTTVAGRKILFAKISDNIYQHEAEPEVMYSSTMHGDETTGYVLMLRLIDYLLSNYNSDPRVQNMVNNMEIWINPNANPDGTYYGGNNNISAARRYNLNGIDLNRSFPDPWGGTTYAIQPETSIMMNLGNSKHFVISANFHGGAEVANYPWDSISSLHVDNAWFSAISTAYATSAQANSPAGYFDDLYSGSIPGVTNGYAWYTMDGGRQDWFTYYRQCREVTMEISSTKMPSASTLPNYWNYNYNSLLTYLENALYGLHGIVTNAYGQPLDATINIVGLDATYSRATTDPVNGDYYRMLMPGTYTVEISTSGYPTQTFTGVVITANQKTTLNAVFGEVPPAQTISLSAGWNFISLNVLPEDFSAQEIFAGISGNLLQVKDANLSYAPSMPAYFNTLTNLVVGKGYWVNMSSPVTLELEGTALNSSAYNLPLNAGWNLVGYLPSSASTISFALASISTYLQEVRYLDSVYIPGAGGNTLTQMQPGKAYWIKVIQPCTLTYPGSAK